ncbi:MAG: efflux RND transporter periplasmic adaptor subunit [Proteobacteria bacterium]|nr:efflux RND transporter periplasmic adaptor subunit [Pseudomonadota bacterium]
MSDLNPPPPLAAHTGGKTLCYARRAGLGLVGLLLAGGALRFAFEHQQARALEQRTADSLLRTVSTIVARPGDSQRSVALPATLQGRSEISVIARSGGYLAAWHKTIGERVKKGELLATIEAPEQDQELEQARAAREQVKARVDLTRDTLKRWEHLASLDSVARQDLDEKRSAAAQTRADLAAVEANVRRLEQLRQFRRIIAPFDGVVTRRSVEVGDLIAANGKELFALAQTDPLRLTLWIPQVYASEIAPGQEVTLRIPETPGRKFTAKVAHAAGALDPVTRTRQVELELPNPDGKLLPGTYGEVTFSLSSSVKALLVPTNVLVTGQDGTRVVSVGQDNTVSFRKVTLGRDLGKEIEIVDGIAAGTVLVSSPSDLLADGESVRPKALPEKPRKGGTGDKPATPKTAATTPPDSPKTTPPASKG